MKVIEVKTITKNGFESVDELISTLKQGEVTVYIMTEDRPQPVNLCDDSICYSNKWGTYNYYIKLDKLDYTKFYTTFTDIFTH